MNFADFAHKEYRNYVVFSELAKTESNPEFKCILEELARLETGHYRFWRRYLDNDSATKLKFGVLGMYKWIRRLFGLTFTLKLLEMHEGTMVEQMREFLFTSDHPDRKQIEEIIHVEEPQEQKLIKQIHEERVEFMGSIVLGLNDGLIELSGALTGFLFAFQRHLTVVLGGIILGVSASLSMASSAYLQARQERSKNPVKSALYTGIAYIVVVILLIFPFVVFLNHFASLTGMLIMVFGVVAGLSFYTAVVFSRSFRRTFIEMLLFSVGTAFVTFLIGSAARLLLGVQI